MIGIDTNVLIRYLTKDDPRQTPKAMELFERGLSEEDPGFISVVAMAETVCVLDRAYGFSNLEIAAAVEYILRVPVLRVESEPEVFTAMIMLRDGYGDFADALIGRLNSRAGCSHAVTFDRKASRLPGFELP
jgi:predicted nucleic-acid-binding protein